MYSYSLVLTYQWRLKVDTLTVPAIVEAAERLRIGEVLQVQMFVPDRLDKRIAMTQADRYQFAQRLIQQARSLLRLSCEPQPTDDQLIQQMSDLVTRKTEDEATRMEEAYLDGNTRGLISELSQRGSFLVQRLPNSRMVYVTRVASA